MKPCARVATSRTGQLAAAGQSALAALSGGFHLAWAISAGVILVTIVLAVTLLRTESATAGVATMESGAGAREREEVEGEREAEEVCA